MTYRVLITISTDDGTHYAPGSEVADHQLRPGAGAILVERQILTPITEEHTDGSDDRRDERP